jgi:hypothetical protein
MAAALSTKLMQYTVPELREMFMVKNAPDEEFRPIVYKDIVFDNYEISQYGNVYSKASKRNLLWSTRDPKRRPEACVSLSIPSNFRHNGFQYRKKSVTFYVHLLVAHTFLKVPDALPDFLQKDWPNMSEQTRRLIHDSLQVDHIDGNPFNPRVDNLQYLTAEENARRLLHLERT